MRPLTPRQLELIRILQGLAPDARHTIKRVCRGTEPGEIEQVVEHRRILDLEQRHGTAIRSRRLRGSARS